MTRRDESFGLLAITTTHTKEINEMSRHEPARGVEKTRQAGSKGKN